MLDLEPSKFLTYFTTLNSERKTHPTFGLVSYQCEVMRHAHFDTTHLLSTSNRIL